MSETQSSPRARSALAVLALAAVIAASLGIAGGSPARGQTGTRTPATTSENGVALLQIEDAVATEGDSGTTSLAFVVRLSDPMLDTVKVDVETLDSTATVADLDYDAASARLTFAPGSVAESLVVTIHGDTRVELDEWLQVHITQAQNGAVVRAEAIGTIVNDDLPSLVVADTSSAEGASGSHAMSFRVRLVPPVPHPVHFQYHLEDGTATTFDADFQFVSGDATFVPGEDQVVIDVPVFGDTLLEANERFSLHIEPVVGAIPAKLSAVGTILNDERTSFLGFSPPVSPYLPGTLPPSWGDLNGDGHPDLQLYLNDQGNNFTEMPHLRMMLGTGNYHGAAWCDYDRDGDMDLVQMPYASTSSDDNFTHLFENTPQGLVDVSTDVGMAIVGFGETPTWADFNADGWPDLFLPFYSHVAPFRSYFYLNLGNGQFLEAADSSGVSMPGLPAALKPEGVAVADWNNDGALDFYCASHLFVNDGDGRFADVRQLVGLPAVFDEGANFVDYDNDGDLDLYLRTAKGPTLYRNDGGKYSVVTSVLGIGLLDWEFGDRWADFDNDGDLDLLFFPPGALARLRLNRGDGTFEEDTAFPGVLSGSGLCSFADMDGDGDVDIAVGANGRRFGRNLLEQVPRARTPALKVLVLDDDGRRTMQGATVRLRSLDDPLHAVQTRIVDGGSGYLGQDEYELTFGGVSSGTFDLEVAFPSKPGARKVVGPTQNGLLAGLEPGGKSSMRVTIRPNGQVAMEPLAALAGVESPSLTPDGVLWPPIPNPARRSTRFTITLPASTSYSLTIHDLSGRLVRTLIGNGRAAAGESVAWDLRDDHGRNVPAGLYFVRLARARARTSVQRVVVLQ